MADAPSTIVTTPEQERLRGEVRELCARFPDEYWRERDRAREYPDAFVDALTEAGYLAVLIPAEYGGGGLGITEGSIVLEEINRSGGHSAGCHAQMYTMGALLKHGSRRPRSRPICRRSRTGRCGCRRSRSPSPRPGRTPPTSPPPRA